jgi:hypothetical protein
MWLGAEHPPTYTSLAGHRRSFLIFRFKFQGPPRITYDLSKGRWQSLPVAR